ncbi:MAG: tetratricopeptide repeat protein [Bacteroidetes bacterium]|nr:tetratricopeptide repeat protein [Bacteroidota bacterium]
MEENGYSESSFGEIVDLVKQFEDAVKSKRSVYFEEEDYEQIIEFYQEGGEYNKALRVTESAISQYSFSSFFYTKKAEILANQRHFDDALSALQESEHLDPTDVNIFLIRSDIHLLQGSHSEALNEVEHALSIAENTDDLCELYLEMADIYEDQEKYPEVVESLKKALEQDPQSEEALNRFWFCMELTESYEESVKFHEALIEKSPYSHLAWYNLGHALTSLGQFEKALDAFGYVAAIDEDFDGSYICSGDVLYMMERYPEALTSYQEAIKISKPNKELYLKTAECYGKMKEFSKARATLRKAISLDPYFDEAFFQLGENYRMEEKWLKSVHNYERAVKLNKENMEYLSALGEAYMSVGDNEKVVEVFEKLFQSDTSNRQNWINLATAYFYVEDFRKAFHTMNEAELKFENSADLFYIKAVFYLKAGNRHEALLNLERGLLTNFDEHTMIFDMDDALLSDEGILQVIEQYRD